MWEDQTVQQMKLGPLYKNRLKKAVQMLQFEATQSGTAADAGAFQVQRVAVVISAKEQQAMKDMEQKLKEIGRAIKENQNDESKLKENTVEILAEIDRVFDIFQTKLTERKEALKTTLREQSETDGTSLKERLQKLKKHQQEIQSASHQFSELLVDGTDPGKRETKIQTLCNEAMKGMDDVLKEKLRPIKFTLEVAVFIAKIGSITAQPAAPIVAISNIKSTKATIKLSSECDKGSISYTVQYRKLIVNDDEKEEEWKEKILNLSDTVVISNLDRSTTYEVRAQYKVTDSPTVTSMVSKVVQFETKKLQLQPMRFHTNLAQLRIQNDGKSVRVETQKNNKCLCVFGEMIDRKSTERGTFEVSFLVERNNYHVAFGFISGSCSTFESGDYNFSNSILCYDDGDFRNTGNVFKATNAGHGFRQGDTVRMHIDCEKGIGKWWKEGQQDKAIETSLPDRFAIAVAMNTQKDTCVRFTNYEQK